MQPLIDRETLRERVAPLEMNNQAFREAGHRLIDRIADFLGSLPDRPVTRGESPSAIREALGAADPVPQAGMEAGVLLEQTAALLFEHSLLNGHPAFTGLRRISRRESDPSMRLRSFPDQGRDGGARDRRTSAL